MMAEDEMNKDDSAYGPRLARSKCIICGYWGHSIKRCARRWEIEASAKRLLFIDGPLSTSELLSDLKVVEGVPSSDPETEYEEEPQEQTPVIGIEREPSQESDWQESWIMFVNGDTVMT
jgi:hypothetical protein